MTEQPQQPRPASHVWEVLDRVTLATERFSYAPPIAPPNLDVWIWVRNTYSIKTIIDIGANTGDYAEFLASFFRPAAVYAFEPLASCQPGLQQLAQRLGNMQVFQVALDDHAGEETFWENEYGPSSSLLHVSDIHKQAFPHTERESQSTVKVARLDDILDASTLERDILIKIDVQGVEDRVIRGGQAVFGAAAMVLVEMSFVQMYEQQPIFDEINDTLRTCGLRLAGVKNQIEDPVTGQPLFVHCLYRRVQPAAPLPSQPEQDWAEKMKADWNARAELDPMHYIMTDRADWTMEEFFATGERDVAMFVDPFLATHPDAPRERALELGCGLGRLTAALATRFAHVDAIDISEGMVEQARELHKERTHVTFGANNGRDLSAYPSASYDFVFSYIVLQHIPDADIIFNYYAEFGRVLKPGGLFLFQVANNDPRGHEKYLERWEQRRTAYHERGESIPFEDYDHAYLTEKIQNFETIIQTPVGLEDSIEVLRRAGLRVDAWSGEGTEILWLSGQKVSDS